MICVIQGILLSHYLCNVNLSNHGLPHVAKCYTLVCFHSLMKELGSHGNSSLLFMMKVMV